MATLKNGHSMEVVNANIEQLVTDGKSHREAKAIAMRRARRSLKDKLVNEGIEVFRAGNYPGKMPVSKQDVESIASNYAAHQATNRRAMAAAKFGHRRDQPAESWVTELRADNGSMIAKFSDPSEEMLDGMITRKWPNISVELRESSYFNDSDVGLSLKSVALLGADPPAVKSIADYSEGDNTDSEGNTADNVSYYGLYELDSDNVINYDEVDNMSNDKDKGAAKGGTDNAGTDNKQGGDNGGGQAVFTEEQVKQLLVKAVADTETRAQEAAKAYYDEQLAKSEQQRNHEANVEFAEQLVRNKQIKPAQRDQMVAILDSVGTDATYGEGDKAQSVSSLLKGMLSSLGIDSRFKPSGISGKGSDFKDSSDELGTIEDEIAAYASEHNCSYTEAENKVLKARGLSFASDDDSDDS